jgi:putative SOS response-associated peptidase YedK
MCGRFTLISSFEELERRFDLEAAEKVPSPRFNVAPGQSVPVITDEHPDSLSFLQWGLIPSWAKDPKIGYRLINARAESVAEKPSFRSSFRSRRCLVPSDGFYEWRKTEEGSLPYYVRMKDREPFAFAGLWSAWKGEGGEERKTFAIITTEANEALKKIHDRMPVILKKEFEREWIDREAPLEGLQELLVPYDGPLEAHRVSTEVNRTRRDDPRLIEKA